MAIILNSHVNKCPSTKCQEPKNAIIAELTCSMKCPHCKDDSGVKWVAFQNKWFTRSHDMKAARQLKTFLTLNWTLHLGHSQNVHSYSLRCFIKEGTHNTRSVEWISWASDRKSGPRDCNNMFVTQNIKINLQPLSPEGQWDKLYTLIKQEDMWWFM